MPRKQRHTAHRIFERLRDEYGFTGGYTIVKDYVHSRRQSTCEAFVPLHHPPGHAQVDFGEAVVELRGQREKVAFFCLILPHSNVWFVKAYPRETTETFLDGHVSAFAFLGGVPRSGFVRQHDPGGGTNPGRRHAASHAGPSHGLRGQARSRQAVPSYTATVVPFCSAIDTNGLSKKDIIRCLKRFVARELYHLLPEPSLPLEPTSTPSPT